ncbi:MAG TPA: RcnB family protein [Sphingomonas sp.]|jgi:Ni/Co efflux regulator RcnB|nr:RcnB family protein [Sphingomonas sp.]
MRTLLIAGTVLAGLTGWNADASAQRMVQRGSGASPLMMQNRQGPPRSGMPERPSRWGTKVGGRWWGGANAPGGWTAYRRPVRGWAVPPYWNSPRFYVTDWAAYGLAPPPSGRRWVRYYDDAVLIDRNGSIFDTASDLDWDNADFYGRDTYAYGDPDGGYGDDRGPPHLPHYGADYADGDYPPPPPPRPPRHYRPHDGARGEHWTSADGSTTIVTGGGYGGGYGGSYTTVTVQSAPVVTTTTTEIIEDRVTWRKPQARKKMWRRKVAACRCR